MLKKQWWKKNDENCSGKNNHSEKNDKSNNGESKDGKSKYANENGAGLDEAGIDGGGLFREFLSQLLKAAFDPNRGFFTLTRDQMLYPRYYTEPFMDPFLKILTYSKRRTDTPT